MFKNRITKRVLVALGLVLSTALLVGFEGQPVWGDPTGRVWYYGELVPFGTLLDKGIEPHCHDALGKGTVTCYNSNEELAAATGCDLPGVDKAAVEHLLATGAVSPLQSARSCYAVVYDAINYPAEQSLSGSI